MLKKTILFTLSIFLLISWWISEVNASEWKYSYEKSESLMHKIKWKSYSNETINFAKSKNKPIFLLLSAPSWCYWCQVYESEEYLFNPKIVKYLNENFVPIFIDADKRQDLTRQYLESGWPSTTVLNPNMERIFGYSWVRPVENMLENLERAKIFVDWNFQNKKEGKKLKYKKVKGQIIDENTINALLEYYQKDLEANFDEEFWWFWAWQKFPQARVLNYLIDEYIETQNKEYLLIINKTLENQFTNISEIQTNYNLFDPIEWWFHRYWTQRDWSPPHYEKMLYDNAKLLKVYFKLSKIEKGNEKAKEVVDKTLIFFDNYFIDKENWWFYSDTSAYLEEEYYWLKDRKKHPKPRVEKTKYTDWNSEAILTFLFLYKETWNEKYKNITENSLEFFEKNMIWKNWSFHFFKNKNEKWVSWNLLDNAYLLLAFQEAYNILWDQKYLKISEELAKYSLENLYDKNTWWFFERNSKEKNLYLKWEEIILKKPFEENSIISYVFLKLYLNTWNLEYLNAWIKTIWAIQQDFSWLDKWAYFIKSLKLLKKSLLKKYSENIVLIEKIDEKNEKNFWLNNLLLMQSENLWEIKNVFEEKKENINFKFYLFAIVSFIAGFLSFISPCTLPILPVFIANLFTSDKKNLFLKTFLFLIWLNLTFAFLWALSWIFWSLLNNYLWIASYFSWILLIIFWFLILFWKWFKWFSLSKIKFSSYLWSFLLWIFLAISWTPCDWPILVSIMALASSSWSIFTSMALLLFYGLWLSIPLLITAFFINKSWNKSKIFSLLKWKELRLWTFKIHTSHLIAGLIFIIIWYLILSWGLIKINAIFSGFDLQRYLSWFEEILMEKIK